MAVVIENCYVNWTLTCDEPDDADCRMRCPGSCDGTCYCETRVSGPCLAVEWIAESYDSTEDAYRGERIEIRSPLNVDVSWDGDNWTWSMSPGLA
jgi:hypothetical protein